MEEKVKSKADMTRKIYAHLGIGTLRDEAALARSKAEAARENRIIVTQKQKKRDIKAH